MPIQRDLYSVDWRQIAAIVKEAAQWQCQLCGKLCRRPGEPFDGHRRTLTVAHWDHVVTAREVFVVALCAPCHLRHDAQHKGRKRRLRRSRGYEQWPLLPSTA